MLGIQRLVFFFLTLVCLVRMDEIIGRSICLADLLAFYDTTDLSCSFTKALWTQNFKDNQRTCLVKCALTKLTPELRLGGRYTYEYELEKLEVKFLKTFFNFTMMKSCKPYRNTDVEMAVTCDVREFYDRRLGKPCNTPSHCNASNPFSTCDTVNGVCECKKGYFAMFNICFPEQLSIGETCELKEPCMESTASERNYKKIGLCRKTEGGKECSLLTETDNMHTSRYTGSQTKSLPNLMESSSTNIHETTILRESFQTNNPSTSTTTSSADIPERTPAYSSKEMAKNRDLPVGIIVGAATAGFVSGIIVCGIVCFILSRCKKSTSTKRSAKFAATIENYGFEVSAISAEKTEHKTVQVSVESSRSDVKRKGGTVPLDDIYNHLHETSGMSGIQPEYDHVPCNDTDGETYHHLDLGNTKNVNTVTRADLENHYN